jgi:hypothetical protein
MAITDTDFRNLTKSVKRNDYPSVAGGYAYFFIPSYDPSYTALPYDLSADWLTRDKWLRYSTYAETMWANAVTIATTKLQSLAYNISGDVPLRVKRTQQLLLHADAGKGWVPFLGKVVKDYTTTNNGCFTEIERYSGAMGARIKGIHHLDSLRCRRTGDTEIPVIYTDLLGYEHEMKYWQVIDLCDMPDARAESLGQGECAAHRAWRTITKLAAIERYVFEKVSGRRPLAIHIVSGVTTKQLEGVVAGSQQSADAKGVVSYMGAALAGSMGDGLSLVTIPLAELPDGFNPEQERKDGYLRYAGALGLDLQDLQPLSGQGLGTGTQSIMLDEKAAGKGLAAFRQDFTHKLNELILDDKTTFAFSENDLRDQKAKAEIAQLRGTFVNDAVASSIITPEQALQVHVDNDDLPREFLPSDETAFTDLSDTEKPVTPDDESEQEITEEPEMLEPVEEEEGAVEVFKEGYSKEWLSFQAYVEENERGAKEHFRALKEASDAKRLAKQEQGRARELYEDVRGE